MKPNRSTRDLVATFLRANVIGVLGALASIGFRWVTDQLQILIGMTKHMISGARELEWWQLLALPTGGALFAAGITALLIRGGGGTGLSDVMEAVSVKRGPLRLRSALSRATASLGIIATGGSVGREGPIITISSAAASKVSDLLHVPVRDRGLMLGCGVAAGFAAAYNAPFAGAIFALEVILGNFAIELFAPVVVASVTATVALELLGDPQPIFDLSQAPFSLQSPVEMGPYIVLGVLSGVAAAAFQYGLRKSEKFFTSLPGPRVGKMALGGLIIGAVAIWYPEVMGNGYEAVNEILHNDGPRLGHRPVAELCLVMAALMTVKLIGTAVTVGSGGAGGVFTPTLFIGAALGGAFGVVLHDLFPEYIGHWGGYALVGMGCLVAGTTRAPIMAVMVVFEMTTDYAIVAPLMLGAITASIVARALYPNSIYMEKLALRGVVLPEGLEETVLTTTRVGDVMRQDCTWVVPATTYTEILPLASSNRATVIHVCGDEKRLLGEIRVHDAIQLAQMGDLGPSIVAADLMTTPVAITTEQTLSEVFDDFEELDIEELPVVTDRESMELIGVVTRRDVMAALHIEVLKRQNLRAKFVHREDEEAQTDYVELPQGVELARVDVHPDHVGRTMAQAQVRVKHQLTVISVVRRSPEGGETRIIPAGDFELHDGDGLIVIGSKEALERWRGST